jgi:hypothetical protein
MNHKPGRPRILDRDPSLDKERLKRNTRKWQEKNRDKQRAAHLKRTYGLLWEDYLNLFSTQGGACKICRTRLSTHLQVPMEHQIAHVDHCHSTGKVRGLLCNKCNSAIGYFNESALLCRLASEYLEEKNDK